MENYDLRYGEDRYSVAQAPVNVRVAFLRRTYAHLAGAILAFVALELVLIQSGAGLVMLRSLQAIPFGMLGLMVAFIAAGYLAQYMARSATSDVTRYAGLGLYVVLEAVIMLPIITIATISPAFAGQYLPLQAGIITMTVFGGLTVATVVSGRDFSFLGPILGILSFAALGLIIAGLIFGFSLGLLFSAGMIILAAGYIVYDTSNVMHHYSSDQHVAAALALFASVALMFYYVLRLLMSLQSRD